MPDVPRSPERHPAVRAVFAGGPVPTDPAVLAELTEGERRLLETYRRLSTPAPAGKRDVRKTLPP